MCGMGVGDGFVVWGRAGVEACSGNASAVRCWQGLTRRGTLCRPARTPRFPPLLPTAPTAAPTHPQPPPSRTCHRHHHDRAGAGAAARLQARQAAGRQRGGGAGGAGHTCALQGALGHAPRRWVGGGTTADSGGRGLHGTGVLFGWSRRSRLWGCSRCRHHRHLPACPPVRPSTPPPPRHCLQACPRWPPTAACWWARPWAPGSLTRSVWRR